MKKEVKIGLILIPSLIIVDYFYDYDLISNIIGILTVGAYVSLDTFFENKENKNKKK